MKTPLSLSKTLGLALSCAVFAVASNLAIYSDNLTAMTLGSGGEPWFRIVTFWLSILLQPWVIAAFCIEAVTGGYVIHMSIRSTAITGMVSSAILFGLLVLAVRRFPGIFRVAVPVLLALGLHSAHIHRQQMDVLERIEPNNAP